MKQILDYLKIEKLGAPVLPPFEKFEGLMAAKVSRRNSESFVVAKWNEDFLTPDVAFDPNANFGMVDEFLELYDLESYTESNFEEDVDEDIDTLEDDLDEEDELIIDTIHLTDVENGVDVDIQKSNIELVVPDDEEEFIIDEPDGNFELDEDDDTMDYPDIDSLESETEEAYSALETFPIFESLTSKNLSKWLSEHGVIAKMTLSKEEKVKLCEKYVADLAKSE